MFGVYEHAAFSWIRKWKAEESPLNHQELTLRRDCTQEPMS
jgi:hypothetical protein